MLLPRNGWPDKSSSLMLWLTFKASHIALMPSSPSWLRLTKIFVREGTTAARAATAFAPSGPMPLPTKPSSCTLVTLLSRSASHRMVVPSSPKSLLLTKILVREAQTAIAGANAAAPSGPISFHFRLSCAQETDSGRHRRDGQGGWEPRVEMRAGVNRWAGVGDGLECSVPR